MRAMALFGLVVLAGCGGGGGSGDASESPSTVIASAAVVSGNSQTAVAGAELASPLVAIVRNTNGQPVPGQTVNFRVTLGGGSVFAGTATSDASGYVRERWTLGTTAGPQSVEVRTIDPTGAAIVLTAFDAIATAGAPRTLTIASGDGQSAPQLESLPLPVNINLVDAFGNPVPGVPISFLPSDAGTSSSGSVATDSLGNAAVSWTLGPLIGNQSLTATATGIAPVTFFATATRALATEPVAIASGTGDSQSFPQHSTAPTPFSVVVTDRLGNPVPGVSVAFAVTEGSIDVLPATATTDNAGTATWAGGYFHVAGAQTIRASVAGLAPVTFSATVTPTNHPFDGVYNCSNNYPVGGAFRAVLQSGAFTFTNVGGQNPSSGFIYPGTFSEADGSISNAVLVLSSAEQLVLTGQINCSGLSACSGSGTAVRNGSSQQFNWSCTRQ